MVDTLKQLVREEYGDSSSRSEQAMEGREEEANSSEYYARLEKDVSRMLDNRQRQQKTLLKASEEKPPPIPPSNKAIQRISSRASSFDSTCNPGSPFQVQFIYICSVHISFFQHIINIKRDTFNALIQCNALIAVCSRN